MTRIRALLASSSFYRLALAGVLGVGSFLRLWRLGFPNFLMFDEVYYVPEAHMLKNYGLELDSSLIAKLFAPRTAPFSTSALDNMSEYTASVNAHAPLGKLLLIPGMALFGDTDPIGWRIGPAILGILLIVATILIAREFVPRWWALLAGLLVAIDGTAIAMSRAALLDGPLATFVAFAVLAAIKSLKSLRSEGLGRRSLVWWMASSTLFGLSASIKLSSLPFYGVAVLVFMMVPVLVAETSPLWRRILAQFGGLAVLFVSYLMGWSTYILHLHVPISRILIGVVGQTRGAAGLTGEQVNGSSPWGWPLMRNPAVMYIRATVKSGDLDQANRVFTVASVGNPLYWGLGCASVAVIAILLLARFRKGLSSLEALGAISVAGFAAGWAPWLLVGNRTVYQYYAVVLVPFVALGLVAVLSILAGHFSRKPATRGRRNALISGVAIGAAALLSLTVYILPLNLGMPLDVQQWKARQILPEWTRTPILMHPWENPNNY